MTSTAVFAMALGDHRHIAEMKNHSHIAEMEGMVKHIKEELKDNITRFRLSNLYFFVGVVI